jgi:hypothetical protein
VCSLALTNVLLANKSCIASLTAPSIYLSYYVARHVALSRWLLQHFSQLGLTERQWQLLHGTASGLCLRMPAGRNVLE